MRHLQVILIVLVFPAVSVQAQQIVLKGLSPQQEGVIQWNPATAYQYKYRGDTAQFVDVGFWGQNFLPVVKDHEEATMAMHRFRENRLAGVITGGAAVLAFSGFVITALNSSSGDGPGFFLLGTMALSGVSYYLFQNSNQHIEEAAREFNQGSAFNKPKVWPAPGNYSSNQTSGFNLGFSINF